MRSPSTPSAAVRSDAGQEQVSRAARTRRGARQKRADVAGPHPDRAGGGRGRPARRRAGGRDPRHPAQAGLGLEHDQAAVRHPARRFPRIPAAQHPARPRAHDRPDALGARSAPKTVLRRDGRVAAAGLGPHHLADPARDGRQSRQQGTGAGRQALSAGVRAGRAVLLRRRPWRAGRRRGLRHRDRNRAAGTLQADAAQGFAASTTPAPRRRPIT